MIIIQVIPLIFLYPRGKQKKGHTIPLFIKINPSLFIRFHILLFNTLFMRWNSGCTNLPQWSTFIQKLWLINILIEMEVIVNLYSRKRSWPHFNILPHLINRIHPMRHQRYQEPLDRSFKFSSVGLLVSIVFSTFVFKTESTLLRKKSHPSFFTGTRVFINFLLYYASDPITRGFNSIPFREQHPPKRTAPKFLFSHLDSDWPSPFFKKKCFIPTHPTHLI